MPDALAKLAELFARFPGIGPRQSRRFVYFLLAAPRGTRETLARLVLELGKAVAACAECGRYFAPGASRGARCAICADPSRDRSILMLVEKDIDLENIERSRAWSGAYFVLGGTVPLLEKNPAARIRSRELSTLVEARGKAGELREIVLALSLTAEGENTAEHLAELLAPYAEKYRLTLSALGRGLSTGSELEYADPDTIRNALKNRQ